MTEKEFKELVAIYGVNVSRWPEDVSSQAQGFANTQPGSIILAKERPLDNLLDLCDKPKQASPEFLKTLLDLPDNYIESNQIQFSLLEQLRNQIPELTNWLRPNIIAAQAFVLFLVLFTGIWAGDTEVSIQSTIQETDLSYAFLSQNTALGENIILAETVMVSEEERR